jgi:hypothetical protein
MLYSGCNPDPSEGNCDRDALLSIHLKKTFLCLRALPFNVMKNLSIHHIGGVAVNMGGVATDKGGRSNSTLNGKVMVKSW